MRRLILIGLLVMVAAPMMGCETIKGLGRDITNAGEAIEDSTR